MEVWVGNEMPSFCSVSYINMTFQSRDHVRRQISHLVRRIQKRRRSIRPVRITKIGLDDRQAILKTGFLCFLIRVRIQLRMIRSKEVLGLKTLGE